ncbi:polyketide cyclase, partial [Cohnella sp. REN36]|nr:polyketide cyclase [Cohnella sp. REN36]
EAGRHIRWEWEMYGVADDIYVKEVEQNKRILIESSDNTIVEWIFTPEADTETFVTITNSRFTGSEEEVV